MALNCIDSHIIHELLRYEDIYKIKTNFFEPKVELQFFKNTEIKSFSMICYTL